jgi:hypothetical protein
MTQSPGYVVQFGAVTHDNSGSVNSEPAKFFFDKADAETAIEQYISKGKVHGGFAPCATMSQVTIYRR